MTSSANNSVNIPLPVDKLNFCELITHCKIGALTARIGTAVADFFTYIIVKIYESLIWFCETIDHLITCKCCSEEDPSLPLLPAPSLPPPAPPKPPITDDNNGGIDLNDLFNYQFDDDIIPHDPPPDQNDGVDYDHLDEQAPEIVGATIKQEAPTPEIAKKRRDEALVRLEQIKLARQIDCPAEILSFDLDGALNKYKTDRGPAKMIQWYDYAMPNQKRRVKFNEVLVELSKNPECERYIAIRNILSKIQYILAEKRARVDNLPAVAKPAATNALKQQIRYIVSRLLDADSNCIDQTLSQLEDIVIEVLATENPLSKNSVISLLQYKAAHSLFRYRANLLKEILISKEFFKLVRAMKKPSRPGKPEKPEDHMADLEREVKKKLAETLGMKGSIIQLGAQFAVVVGEKVVEEAKEAARGLFLEQYKPVEFLQEQCQVIWGPAKDFRRSILQWAETYYGLSGDDELSKAVSEDQQALESLCTIGAVELTKAGALLFLEAAGILKIRKS